MSVEITIYQRRLLFKKALPLSVLTGNVLRYGVFDGLRIQPGNLPKTPEDSLILYHPKHIGRGFSASWHKNTWEQISLHLPAPSTTKEIDDFYDTVSRICTYWGAEWFEQNGEPISVLKIGEQRIAIADLHLNILHTLCTSTQPEITLWCTYFPLVLGENEKAMFRNVKSLRTFCAYLHEKQSTDLYYPIPQFFHEDGSLCGFFVIPSDTDCVLPRTPKPPHFSNIPEQEVAHWYVTFFPSGGDSIEKKLKYRDFLEAVHFEELNDFDAAHHILPGMSPQMQRDLLEQLSPIR